MKKLYLLMVLMTISIFSYCQITDNYWMKLESDASIFSQASDSFNIYLNSTYPDSIPSEKLGNIKDYFRFTNFWSSRIGVLNNETSFKPYRDAILNLLTDPVCDDGEMV